MDIFESTNTSLDYEDNRKSLFGFYFLIILSFLGLLVAMTLIFPKDTLYTRMYLVPLSTSIMFFASAFVVKNLDNNIINIIIYTLYFIRNIFSFYLLYLVNFETIVPVGDTDIINRAIYIMISETLFVFIYLSRTNNIKNESQLDPYLNYSFVFKILLISFSIVCLLFYIVDSSIRSSFTTILAGDIIELSSYYETSTFFFSVFNRLLPIVQLMVPLYLIGIIRGKLGQTNISILLSIILAMTPLLLISGRAAYSLVMVVALLLTIIRVFPKYKNSLFIFIGVIGSSILLVFIVQKLVGYEQNLSRSIQTLSHFFQSYFPGFRNIVGAMYINPSLITSETVRNELITFIPLRQLFISDWQFLDRALHHFQNAINNPYQIMSNISIGQIYLGYFAPLISVGLLFIANKFNKFHTNNIIIYGTNIYIALFFAIGPVMLNVTNVGSRFSETFVWLILISRGSDIKKLLKIGKVSRE